MSLAPALVITLALASSGAPERSPQAAASTPADCADRYTKALDALEPTPPIKRARPVLELIAAACTSVPEELRTAAAAAAKVKTKRERAKLLGTAAAKVLDASCRPIEHTGRAFELARTCEAMKTFSQTETELKDLDQGTLAFMLALDQTFAQAGSGGESGPLRDIGRRLISNLALASALEHAAASRKK